MKLHQDDIEMMDYIDGLILTRDDDKLNELIKSIYFTLILDDFDPETIDRYLNVKVQYLAQQQKY